MKKTKKKQPAARRKTQTRPKARRRQVAVVPEVESYALEAQRREVRPAQAPLLTPVLAL